MPNILTINHIRLFEVSARKLITDSPDIQVRIKCALLLNELRDLLILAQERIITENDCSRAMQLLGGLRLVKEANDYPEHFISQEN